MVDVALKCVDNAEDYDALSDFLSRNNIFNYSVEPVGEDMAPRRYYRLKFGGQTKILCVSPPDHDPRAHQGHLISKSVKRTQVMLDQGVHVPRIYDAEPDQGFALFEDFGDIRFDQAIERVDIKAMDAYQRAARILKKINAIGPNAVPDIKNFYDGHVHKARGRLIDWYLPVLCERKNKPGLTEEYLALWDDVEASSEDKKLVVSHIDYHIMNLMHLGTEQGDDACGVLDFQDMQLAPDVYDLVNLLGDARRDVPEDIQKSVKDQFCSGMDDQGRKRFDAHYAILSAQFHSRCLGQFIQLAYMGKPQYLQYIPGLLRKFKVDLSAPNLKPIKDWLDAQGMDFDTPIELDIDKHRAYISDDAF